MKEVDLLDLDSGIRTFGDYEGKKRQFVFVTRSPHDSYTLMIYAKKASGANLVPGKRLLVREFQKKEDLDGFTLDHCFPPPTVK
jgi:hypothetical protein